MRKELSVILLSLLLLCIPAHSVCAYAESESSPDTLAALPIWDGPEEESTEGEIQAEIEAVMDAEDTSEAEDGSGPEGENADGDALLSEEEPPIIEEETAAQGLSEDERESLIRTLLMLRLKYGDSFTFAMNEPEDPPAPAVSPHPFSLNERELPGFPLPSLPKRIGDLEEELTSLVDSYSGTWSVYVKNLRTEDVLIIHDQPMKSASVMKLFIMASIYDAIDQNQLERTSEVIDLLSNMISYSSNDAANRLLRILGEGDLSFGVARVNQYIREHGYSSMSHQYNGFSDSSTILDHEHFNQISARDCGLLLERIYHRTFASRRVCNEIEEMMLRQQTRYKIPKGLPDGVSVGNKTGEMDTVENDVAVVYAAKSDYILCVLSEDWAGKDAAQRDIQEISAAVYRFFNDDSYYLTDPLYRIVSLPEPEEPVRIRRLTPSVPKPYAQKWRNPKYETVGKNLEK